MYKRSVMMMRVSSSQLAASSNLTTVRLLFPIALSRENHTERISPMLDIRFFLVLGLISCPSISYAGEDLNKVLDEVTIEGLSLKSEPEEIQTVIDRMGATANCKQSLSEQHKSGRLTI